MYKWSTEVLGVKKYYLLDNLISWTRKLAEIRKNRERILINLDTISAQC